MPHKDLNELRKFKRNWVANRRAEYLADKSCKNCSSKDQLMLQKRKGVEADHRLWSWSAARRIPELAKFEVVCKTCHFKAQGAKMRKQSSNPNENWCNSCEIYKPNTEFYARKKRWNGLSNQCKSCNNQQVENYRNSVWKTMRRQLKKWWK